MATTKAKIDVKCPKCGSTDIANLTGPDDAIVTCNGCGKGFGSAGEVRSKVMADAKKQAVALARKSLKSTIRKFNKR